MAPVRSWAGLLRGGDRVPWLLMALMQCTLGRVEEQRRIPWAPRVIAPRETAVLVDVDQTCRVAASIRFQVVNFKLQQDGDVKYRYEDGSLLQEGQLGRGSIFCGVEGKTDYDKPVFECSLDIVWRADLLLTPTVSGQEGERQEEDDSDLIQDILQEIPAGRGRMASRLLASKAHRLFAQGAWASAIGSRGPPSAVLSETASFMQCRGPIAGKECTEDRWELSLSSAGTRDEGMGMRSGEQGEEGVHWIAVDLGSDSSLIGLFLDWGPDAAHEYDVQVSQDAVTWVKIWTETNGPTERLDSSVHTVHSIDFRKGNTTEIVRPNGETARYVRIVIRRGPGSVSLWRLVPLGRRHDSRMKGGGGASRGTPIPRLQLYLTDKGGNELGVTSTLMQVIIIDPRPICPFVYLVYSPTYRSMVHLVSAGSTTTAREGQHNGLDDQETMPSSSCILHLTTQEQHGNAIFAFNYSVAMARNLLFHEAQKRAINYLYLVFVDGDALLDEVADFGFSSRAGAYATLEKYLMRWLPAVGFPHHSEAQCDYDEALEVQLSYNFNLVATGVTAMHREAVTVLLPYPTQLEHQSPWQAGVVQNAVASIMYQNHVIQFNALRVRNRISPSLTPGAASSVWRARDRHAEALAWLAPAILSIHAVNQVSWTDPFAGGGGPPGGGSPASKTSTYLLSPGLPWQVSRCHAYWQSKTCAVPAATSSRCQAEGGDKTSIDSANLVCRVFSHLQELQRQLLAQPLRSQSFWQTRPFRVRSPQSGIQVGLVAASLSELQTEVAEALEIHHPWFIRLLLVEPDGRGATEILDERFFATVPANSLLLALRAEAKTEKLVAVPKYTTREN